MFLFIQKQKISLHLWNGIQIHLMFLFITFQCIYCKRFVLIQIHLMFLFISSYASQIISIEYSNTSHVLIYQYQKHSQILISSFKYISCSYLSSCNALKTFIKKNSNTSHVLIYQIFDKLKFKSEIDSNTSHVLIYLAEIKARTILVEFKYISCSYLSLSGNIWSFFN